MEPSIIRHAQSSNNAMHRSLETATTVGSAIGIQPEVWIDLHGNGESFLDHHDGRELHVRYLNRVPARA